MIKEINGYFTCTLCGYEWSAMLGDDELQDKCNCEKEIQAEEDKKLK